MKFSRKKIYIILFSLTILWIKTDVFAKDNKISYKGENISNYFLGIISANQDYNIKALKHLKKSILY